jgi:hypothetical protein
MGTGMSDLNNQTGSEGSSSVSALGLRWAALRGMLSSPLIEAEEQRSLREDLVRELQTIERDFATLPARNSTEVSAKIDVAKTVLRQGAVHDQSWLVALLDSVQTDLRAMSVAAPSTRHERTPANLQRRFPSAPQPNPVVPTLAETETPAA